MNILTTNPRIDKYKMHDYSFSIYFQSLENSYFYSGIEFCTSLLNKCWVKCLMIFEMFIWKFCNQRLKKNSF